MLQKIFFLCLIVASFDNFAQTPSFKVGLAKTDITSYVKGGGMLGYSMAFNVAEGIETHLFARSFVIEDAKRQKVALVETELCFVTSELKRGIIQLLQKEASTQDFTEENVLIMAQHTHCGPGGFCHYASYNMSVPGYIPEVYTWLCRQIAKSIREANAKKIPCNIKLNKGFFPEDWEVAFNRSLAAYNLNKDVTPLPFEKRNQAVNREMTLLHFEGENKQPLGSINWFGVHATNISNDKKMINADNKGYAATFLEEYYAAQNKNYVGAFGQGSAGDVTPKFIYNPKLKAQRGYWEGKFPDDVQSAKYNGELQFKKAKELIEGEQQHEIKNSEIHCALRYFDFSNIKIDTFYSNTKDIKYTSPSCISMTMLGGALMDGPAAPKPIVSVGKMGASVVKYWEISLAKLAKNAWADTILRKYKVQGKKDIVLETGYRKILGTKNIKNLIIPGFADGTLQTFKYFHRKGALGKNPWSPQILPVQFVQIGDVVLAALPFEITTTAGRRLKKGIELLYKNDNIKEVILCPYSNSYSGYITTYEEYQAQMYEGGHTVFGEYSLAALQTVFRQLYAVKKVPFAEAENRIEPPVFDEKELEKRRFYWREEFLAD